MVKVLIIGSGGREHAIGWRLGRDSDVSEVLYAPGNGGTQEGKGRNLMFDGTKKENFGVVLDVVEREKIDLTIVGPEAPLTDGLVNYLNENGYDRVFGPTQLAAQLEADKFFSYNLMDAIGIPQATSFMCSSMDDARDAIGRIKGDGVVIKARGLTGGKGVSVHDSQQEALDELAKHSARYGPEVLIAERLRGEEYSVFGISDGENVRVIPASFQDHKLLLDGDKGVNTGGMGAYGPAKVADNPWVEWVEQIIMQPVVRVMKRAGREYRGFLYAGMMRTPDGHKVIEFNARFGDPECQPAMMLVKDGFYATLDAAVRGNIGKNRVTLRDGVSCCVVLASPGYPESYPKGMPIEVVPDESDMLKVFHAGTQRQDGRLISTGGRVLGVTGYAPDLENAIGRAYAGCIPIKYVKDAQRVPFYMRTDIGRKGL